MKVLISAYACEPNRGSEPGVGWEWATRLSKEHEVTVITRANNQTVIENELSKLEANCIPNFIYLDLPKIFTWLKKNGMLSVSVYYLFWQLLTRIMMIGKLRQFDLVHHVTFNGFRFPGAWWNSPIPVVLGPLGGGSIASPAFRRCFGERWTSEWLRSLSVRMWKCNPWTILSLISGDAILAVGKEMAKRFESISIQSDLMLETAVPAELEGEPPAIAASKRKDFLLVGNLEPWKAWQIAFDAFSQACSRGLIGHRLIVIGTGRQIAEAKERAIKLGVDEKIIFLGQLSRERLWERVNSARGLIFCSIRDTSGNAALEAMALGCPVICFNHQGVGWMTDDKSALRIEPRSWEQSIEDFSHALVRLAESDELVDQLGKAARKRAMENFSWDAKIKAMSAIYESVVKEQRSNYS